MIVWGKVPEEKHDTEKKKIRELRGIRFQKENKKT